MENVKEPTAAEGATGYKRPPVEHQFPKGKSRNPAGRVKGQRNLATVLTEVLAQTVKVRHGKKSEVMTKGEACIKMIMSKAHNGDHRAVEALIALTEKIGRIEERPKDVLNNYSCMIVPGMAESREEYEEMVRRRPVSIPWWDDKDTSPTPRKRPIRRYPMRRPPPGSTPEEIAKFDKEAAARPESYWTTPIKEP
jgi:hypothetical protein